MGRYGGGPASLNEAHHQQRSPTSPPQRYGQSEMRDLERILISPFIGTCTIHLQALVDPIKTENC